MIDSEQTYITKRGLDKLKDELKELKNSKRQEIAERIAQAKELGDLSENAEYQEAKNEQAFNEGRVLELEAVLKNAIIIEEEKGPKNKVNVGSKITIKEQHPGEPEPRIKQYHIVGSHEAAPEEGKISNVSPIGQALLGAKKGAMIEINLPKGTIKAEIVEIK